MKTALAFIITLLFLSYYGVITIHPDRGYQLIKNAGQALVSEAKKQADVAQQPQASAQNQSTQL